MKLKRFHGMQVISTGERPGDFSVGAEWKMIREIFLDSMLSLLDAC